MKPAPRPQGGRLGGERLTRDAMHAGARAEAGMERLIDMHVDNESDADKVPDGHPELAFLDALSRLRGDGRRQICNSLYHLED